MSAESAFLKTRSVILWTELQSQSHSISQLPVKVHQYPSSLHKIIRITTQQELKKKNIKKIIKKPELLTHCKSKIKYCSPTRIQLNNSSSITARSSQSYQYYKEKNKCFKIITHYFIIILKS